MINQKILIIDDEKPLTLLLKTALEDKYDVATTTSAQSALKYITKNDVDLILLDIRMPGMNGIEALREIRKTRQNTHVIMLTAYASNENKQQAKELGAHGFITKPFDINELRNYVHNTLTRKQ